MPSVVTVYSGRIASITQYGDVARFTHGVAKDVERFARIYAPKRTGRLAASHVTLPARGSNQFEKRYRVSAMAPYSAAVALGSGIYGRGSGAPIVSKRGKKMGPIGGAGPRYIRSSKGQRPNNSPGMNWLEKAALTATMLI
jgi:hypothetical protein